MKIDPKTETTKRIKRTEAYAEKVRLQFAQTVNEILALNKRVPVLDEGVMFSFDGESMRIQKEVERLLRQLHSVATMAIKKGIILEWEIANDECDKLIASAFGKKVLESPEFSAWCQRNESARDAFISRSDKGLKLSDRVWKAVRQLRDEMEVAMTVAIGEGDSAASMSKKVRAYLNDPDLMFRRFRYKKDEDAEGNPVYGRKWKKRIKDEATGKYKWIDYDRDDYKTGAGVYKSSAKNAMRVARTETNIAYRRADNERWQQMDFVLGQRVQLSRSHPKKDICDKLAGEYPKEFVFDGWHPQCFCFVTPILIDEDEMAKITEAMLKGEKYTPRGRKITEYPESFKEWIRDNADNIAEARDRGTEPYFIRNNAEAVDEILNPQEKELTTLEKAAIRHANRTPEEIASIKARAVERQKKHQLIRTTANNILKVAGDYGEVDYSTLQKYVQMGDLTNMQKETRVVAKAISEMKKQEKALSVLIPNAHTLHKTYSIAELKEAYKEIEGVFSKWLSKYSYASVDAAPLAHLKNKLDFEITNPTISYSQHELVKKALQAKITLIEQKILWEDLVAKAASFRSFKTKSSTYKTALADLDTAINSGDTIRLQQSIDKIEKQRQKLIDKQVKRGGDTKSALNPEFKGTAVGKDITSSFDATSITHTDDYRGTPRYTNDVARMQGFDAPAKLVTDTEFEVLASSCGDVFYRTVNPLTYKGKSMTGKEFADLYFTDDTMDMNGRGGRVYGDGIYVASAAWDGHNIQPLTTGNRKSAFRESADYGGRGCETMEMTWVRPPRLIKQDELHHLFYNLSSKEQAKYGNHENTYGCALGYDGMYCCGPNYIVVWNRSIIAIKKK